MSCTKTLPQALNGTGPSTIIIQCVQFRELLKTKITTYPPTKAISINKTKNRVAPVVITLGVSTIMAVVTTTITMDHKVTTIILAKEKAKARNPKLLIWMNPAENEMLGRAMMATATENTSVATTKGITCDLYVPLHPKTINNHFSPDWSGANDVVPCPKWQWYASHLN